MPTPGFSLVPDTNPAEFGAAYTLFATDDAPLRGQVFLDMSEHRPTVDGSPQIRSMVIVRFFGLTVTSKPLGNPRVLMRFHPGDPGRGATAALCLGEPGRMHLDLGFPLDTVDPELRDLVTDTVLELTSDFLTDERAARHRHSCAHQRREDLATTLHAIGTQQQCTRRQLAAARAQVDAAWALLQTLRQQN